MRFAVIPSEARYDFASHVFCAMNPSSIRMSRKKRFLTPTKRTGRKTRASQTPFGMSNSRFFSKLLGYGLSLVIRGSKDDLIRSSRQHILLRGR